MRIPAVADIPTKDVTEKSKKHRQKVTNLLSKSMLGTVSNFNSLRS